MLTHNQLLPTCLSLGQALQASGRWDSAMVVYNYTIAEFYPPVDNMGELVLPAFHLPAHLYRVFDALGDTKGAAREFARAEEYYRRVIGQFPDTKLSRAAHLTLADLYDETRQWKNELAELSTLVDTTMPGYQNILLRVADVHGGGLREFDTALSIYNHLLERLGTDDTAGMGPEILFKISLVRMEQKKFDEARSVIGRLKRDYPKYYDTVPMPQYTLARSFELDDKWERAESEYGLLTKKYLDSDEAMMALLYMIDYLRNKGRTAESQAWYDKAEKYYDDAALRGRGTLLEARAMFYKAELRRRKADYAAAAEILLTLFGKFPDTEPGQKAIMAAATLFRDNLGDSRKADSLLNLRKQYLSKIVEAGSK
jgi:tetratricopeptide (TPR) repeat protein